MGVCRGDSSHKPNSPFHAISEVPWIIQITAVMVVGVYNGVDNTHNHNSILKASQKGLSDEVHWLVFELSTVRKIQKITIFTTATVTFFVVETREVTHSS